MIGDSYTFGQGIAEDERMSNLLEKELRQRRGAVDVVNLGNAGNNTADEVRVLQTALVKVKPDYVLLQWFINDVDIPENVTIGGAAWQQPSRLNEAQIRMRNTSVLYFLAAETWHKLFERSGAGYTDEMLRRVGDPNSSASQRAQRALREFVSICKNHGVPLGIVLVPSFTPLQDREYPFLYLHQRVLAACADERVPCLDLFPTFAPLMRNEKTYRDLWVNRFDPHMGPTANRIAATRMLEFFGASWTAAHGSAQ